jgi:tetratricopeptide (TPR) repeat protein
MLVSFFPGMPAAGVVPLVGRRKELEEIRKAVEAEETRIVYITGQGGIGKTRLVQEVLNELRENRELAVAQELIDFYHIVNRSLEGLLEAIRTSVGLDLPRYQEAREELERLVLTAGATFREIDEKRREMAKVFLEEWNEKSEEKRIVVAFDTLEKLHYESDRAQELLGVELEYPVVRSWLFKEFLPKASNTLILLAGRPRKALERELKETLKDKLVEIELGAFSEEETEAYFEAIKNNLAEGSIERQRLEKLSTEMRKVINILTGGRPILISLVADYLATADLLLPIFGEPFEKVAGYSEKELERARAQVERELVNQFRELPDPLRYTVYYLAWTRKGMEPELLAKIMGLNAEEAKERLEKARKLSFVKTRPGDSRVFLHDEMYELAEKHIFPLTPPGEHERIYSSCIRFYEEKIETLQDELAKLYRERGKTQELAQKRRELMEAKAALVHYGLMHEPSNGFSLYFKAAEEAYHGADIEADMLLREEILDFLALKFAEGEEVNGLKRKEVEAELSTRWVKRLINLGKFEKALEIAKEIEGLAKEVPIFEVDLLISKAFAQIMMWKDIETAEQWLREAIERLEKMLKKEPVNEFIIILWAKAHNYMGYLSRIRGQYKKAVESYKKAIVYQRLLKLETQQAETLNNSAFASAEAGEPNTAKVHAQDALELRLKFGFPYPIGLSYNTMALVEIRLSDYPRAKDYAEKARKIFEEIGNLRGVGLAYLALAEALLRLSAKPALTPEEFSWDNRLKLLKKAEIFAKEALHIFQNLYPEEEREIEAWLRLGCVHRDQARFCKKAGKKRIKEKEKKAMECFEEVINRAKDKMPYRAVEAIVDEAWLEYYMDRSKKAMDKSDEAFTLIPDDYKIPGKPEEIPLDACLPFWAQLGKIEVLRGVMAFDEFEKNKDRSKLEEAIKHFARGLAYNELVSEHSHGFHLALFTVYDRLKGLNVREIKTAYDALEEFEKDEPAFKLGRERVRLWDKMEKWFGGYEIYKKLPS